MKTWWKDDKMTQWHDDEMTVWHDDDGRPLHHKWKHDDRMTKWHNDTMTWWHVDAMTLGVEQNRKQRFPVNSITSKLVLKSIYASGSTGPFFADHYLNIWIDSTQVSPRKTDFLSRYLVLSEIRYARKRNWSKTGTGIFCQKFLIFLKSLKSLNKNFY